jgi:hypothetical protein
MVSFIEARIIELETALLEIRVVSQISQGSSLPARIVL